MAHSRANIPEESPGPRMKVGVMVLPRTSR
jgi:hypothetical protein